MLWSESTAKLRLFPMAKRRTLQRRSRSKPTVDAQALNADAAAPAARPDGIFVDCGRGKAANPKSSVQPYQARHVCEEDDFSPACLHDFSSSR